MPFPDLLVSLGQLVVAGVEKIFEHPEQIEIHKARPVFEHERQVRQHHLERKQPLFQLLEPEFLVLAPLVKAAVPKFAFFEPEKIELLRHGHIFLPINIVQPERRALDFIFNAAPEDGLDVAPFVWKQAKFEFFVEIFGDDLRIVADFKQHVPAVLDDRHAVITLLGEFPDPRAVLVGNVDDSEADSGKFQDAPLNDAERTPRKLNQLNHVKSSNCVTDGRTLGFALHADKRKHHFTLSRCGTKVATWLLITMQRSLWTRIFKRTNRLTARPHPTTRSVRRRATRWTARSSRRSKNLPS